MDVLDSYKIDLKNMRTDVAEYQFALDDAFFEAVEGTLVKSGKADADLKIRESGGAYVFTFHIKGTVHVPCDRCLDDMDVEIETERMLTVKLGDEYADEGYDDTAIRRCHIECRMDYLRIYCAGSSAHTRA